MLARWGYNQIDDLATRSRTKDCRRSRHWKRWPEMPQQRSNVCGASRESINRCLGGWQRRDIGETEKRTIRKLLDEELAEQNG
jgi:hypothetical protein